MKSDLPDWWRIFLIHGLSQPGTCRWVSVPLPQGDIEAFSIYRLVFHMVFTEIFDPSPGLCTSSWERRVKAGQLDRPSALHYPSNDRSVLSGWYTHPLEVNATCYSQSAHQWPRSFGGLNCYKPPSIVAPPLLNLWGHQCPNLTKRLPV